MKLWFSFILKITFGSLMILRFNFYFTDYIWEFGEIMV